jgi:hypothetical protein
MWLPPEQVFEESRVGGFTLAGAALRWRNGIHDAVDVLAASIPRSLRAIRTGDGITHVFS